MDADALTAADEAAVTAVIEALDRLDGAGDLKLPSGGDALETAMWIDGRARHEAALVLSRFTGRS